MGQSLLDRHYTQPMLPWILSEVRRRKEQRAITLEILPFSVRGTDTVSKKLLFEHHLKSLSRFARPQQDLSIFAYLTRPNSESPFSCHVFKVSDQSLVPELFTAIRDATKEAVKDYNSNTTTPRRESDTLEGLGDPNARHFFEVLYVGKVIVSDKKAPPTFIDDAVEKFRLYEIDKFRRQSTGCAEHLKERHNSNASLPGNLERQVDLKENQLAMQVLRMNHERETSGSSGSGVFLETSSTPTDGTSNTNNNSTEGLNSKLGSSADNLLQFSETGRPGSGELTPAGQVEAPPRKNRTLLLQVGRTEISLISPDKKKVMLERKFKDISFCSQGIKEAEHFGFISREPKSGNFLCYVFKCATESVVEDVMLALKQAFHVAFSSSAKKNIVCELCPMHQLHKLCQEIEGLEAHKAFEVLHAKIDLLPEKEKEDTWAKFREEDPKDYQMMNEVLMTELRHICEARQKEHVHLSDKQQSKGEGMKKEKDESVRSQRSRSMSGDSNSSRTTCKSTDSQYSVSPNASPSASPTFKDAPDVFPSPDPPPRSRRIRSSTVGSSSDMDKFWNEVEQRISQERELKPPSISSKESSPEPKSIPLKLEDVVDALTPSGPMYEELGPKRMKSPSPSGVDNLTPHPTPQVKNLRRPSRVRRISWRRNILDRVATPVQRQDSVSIPGECLNASKRPKHTPQQLRALWKKAILETLLLIRMEKENNTLQARQDAAEIKRIKLDYEEITPCLKEITKVWDQMLLLYSKEQVKFHSEEIGEAVRSGVPRHKRSEIWQLLCEQHKLHHPDEVIASEDPGTSYDNLLKQLTSHQHAILIDLGRTFPNHPYFSTQLGPGQLALFNLMKAYSLLDREVGYCQGLSFIAGILLMHMREDHAFAMLRYMMFNLGFREQYKPDMVSLQIQMYQLSRLLHDHYKDLYDHFEAYDIAPTLYAAPWFLTMFASQFPLGFVARVYDLIFLQGVEVVYKVALMLLGNHKELIMECHSFESIVEFLKTTLPDLGIIQMERVINQVFNMDISRQLHSYEVEYHVLQEELVVVPSKTDTDNLQRLESINNTLRKQNQELIDQLQASHAQHHTWESQINQIQHNENKLKSHIKTLELERAALLNTVAKLRQLVPEEVLDAADISIPSLAPDKTITNSPLHNPNIGQLLQTEAHSLFASASHNGTASLTDSQSNTFLKESRTWKHQTSGEC